MQAMFILIVNLFVLLPSDEYATNSGNYYNLYGNLWFVLIASSTAVPIAYFSNQAIISRLKIYWGGRFFWLRYIASAAVGNLILVSISYPINFYGLYPLDKIIDIAAHNWTFKMICACVLFPIGIIIGKAIKKVERLDFYDYGVSYNPLKVFDSSTTGKNEYDKRK